MKKILDITSTIVLIVAAVVVVWKLVAPQAAKAAMPPSEDVTFNIPDIPAAHLSGSRDAVAGDPVLVEFTDYECPFCKQFATKILPEVQRQVPTAQVISLNYPLAMHPHAKDAASVAICAAQQERLTEMHKTLFELPQLADVDYHKLAEGIGMNGARFENCRVSSILTLNGHTALGEKLGVKATPTIFVGTVSNGTLKLKRKLNGVASAEVLVKEVNNLKRSE